MFFLFLILLFVAFVTIYYLMNSAQKVTLTPEKAFDQGFIAQTKAEGKTLNDCVHSRVVLSDEEASDPELLAKLRKVAHSLFLKEPLLDSFIITNKSGTFKEIIANNKSH